MKNTLKIRWSNQDKTIFKTVFLPYSLFQGILQKILVKKKVINQIQAHQDDTVTALIMSHLEAALRYR